MQIKPWQESKFQNDSFSPFVTASPPQNQTPQTPAQNRLIMDNLSHCFGIFDPKHSQKHKRPSTMIQALCHRFSLAQLQKSTNNFDKSQMITSDYYFAGLYKGCTNIAGTDYKVWIKRFRREYDQNRKKLQLSEFKNEIELLCQLHHPNLISLIGFCDEKDELTLVYEYMPNRSLSDQLHHRWDGKKPLSWKRRLEICIGAARGLHYLHSGGKHTIFHRDIQSRNILLDENWVPKLAEFGISLKGPSFISKEKSFQVDKIRGKTGFLPPDPEYYLEGTLTDRFDVHMFGMILLEVVCGKTASTILNEIYFEETKEAVDEDRENEDVGKYEHSFSLRARQIRSYAETQNGYKVIDPYIIRNITPECWKIYMDIAESCLLAEATVRPTMGEVQLELEHALEIQEEADTECSFPQPEEANNERNACRRKQ